MSRQRTCGYEGAACPSLPTALGLQLENKPDEPFLLNTGALMKLIRYSRCHFRVVTGRAWGLPRWTIPYLSH